MFLVECEKRSEGKRAACSQCARALPVGQELEVGLFTLLSCGMRPSFVRFAPDVERARERLSVHCHSPSRLHPRAVQGKASGLNQRAHWVCIYYCSTFDKAVRVRGGGEWRTPARPCSARPEPALKGFETPSARAPDALPNETRVSCYAPDSVLVVRNILLVSVLGTRSL